jgi:phosphoribosylaminoimidazole-succinocarboxamide synthase
MAKREQLYEGSEKILLEGPEPSSLVMHFKDSVTAFNNQKQGTIVGKGVLNNRISGFLMSRLNDMGIPTHFIKNINMREQLIQEAQVFPIRVIVRNLSAGEIVGSFGIEEGSVFPQPLIEFRIKSDELKDPVASRDHLDYLCGVSVEEQETIRRIVLRANDLISGIFFGVGMRLIDVEFELGRVFDEELGSLELIIVDEISPDTCRLWDLSSGEKLDRDRFRDNLGQVEQAYQEVARRLGVLAE